MDKAELMKLLDEMLQSGDTSNIRDLVETGVNEIVVDTRRDAAAQGYTEGYRDGVAEGRGTTS